MHEIPEGFSLQARITGRRVNPYDQCLEALKAPALTHDELVAKQCQVAAIAAEDERKRAPAPQLPLEVAA
jgi:hypothetical protein